MFCEWTDTDEALLALGFVFGHEGLTLDLFLYLGQSVNGSFDRYGKTGGSVLKLPATVVAVSCSAAV